MILALAALAQAAPGAAAAGATTGGADPSGPVAAGSDAADPNADAGGADPSGADGGADPSRADPSGADAGGADPADPSGADPSGPDSGATDPSGADSGAVDPNGPDAGGADPSGADPSGPDGGADPSGPDPSGPGDRAASPRGVESGLTPPAGLDRAYASRRVALVVGIDDYVDPALGDLAYAGKDASDLAAILRDPAVGGYDLVSVVAGEVTREAFWDAFRALGSTVQRDDTVVVYVASHGTLDLGSAGTELYLLGSDAWLANAAETGVAVPELAAAVEALPARRTVLVLDACYSGSGRSVLAPEVERKLQGLRGPVPDPPALVVSGFSAHLYAAHLHQPSLEDPSLENGVYTHFLLEALRGDGDRDGDGLVEVMEAHGWARDRTLAYTGGTQVPWAETVAVGREALYLAGDPARRKAAEHALLTGLEALPQQAVILVDGLPRGGGPLEEGRRRIEVQVGQETWLRMAPRVHPGRDVDLAAQLARRSARGWLGVGPLGSPDVEWLGPVGVVAEGGFAPRDPGGGRPELWLQGSARSGPARDPGERFPAGTVAAGLGWSVPLGLVDGLGAVELGPTLGAGVAWRLPDDPGPQAAPLVQAGTRLRLGWAELAVDAAGFTGEGRLVVVPSGSLRAAVTLPSGHR